MLSGTPRLQRDLGPGIVWVSWFFRSQSFSQERWKWPTRVFVMRKLAEATCSLIEKKLPLLQTLHSKPLSAICLQIFPEGGFPRHQASGETSVTYLQTVLYQSRGRATSVQACWAALMSKRPLAKPTQPKAGKHRIKLACSKASCWGTRSKMPPHLFQASPPVSPPAQVLGSAKEGLTSITVTMQRTE